MSAPSGRRRLLVAACMAGLLVGCGASGDDDAAETTTTSKPEAKATTTTEDATTTTEMEGRGDIIPDEPEQPAGPQLELQTVVDPTNGAFEVGVPVGWDNLVYCTVDGQVHKEVVSSVSPDGGTVVFIGDPKIPSYWNPDTADPITQQFAEWLPTMDLARYDPAPSYFEAYVTRKFGELADFSLTSVEPNEPTRASLVEGLAAAGIQALDVSAVNVRFTFTDEEGNPTEAIVIGTTIDNGSFWSADVLGLASTGTVDDYLPMVSAMTRTKKTRPEFIASQNQRHEQTMAMIQQRTEEMTRQHQANMAWIQDSANAHQQRMQSIWAANDASVAGFYDRMASGDVQQRGFLNYINEESTVQSSSGQKFQVDASYDRYWVNPSTGEYAGGDVNFGESQLRELGLNPSDYEEMPTVAG